jgi:hypothetical protein
MAPQGLENIESAPGNGMVPEDSNPQDLVHGRATGRTRLRLTSRMTKSRSSRVALRTNRNRRPRRLLSAEPVIVLQMGAAWELQGNFSSLQIIEKARNGIMFGADEDGRGGDVQRGNPSWRADPLGASSPEGKRHLYPRATRCALASQSLWLLRTCAGARRRSRTTSSAITWASAARPRRCSSCAWRTRGSGPG